MRFSLTQPNFAARFGYGSIAFLIVMVGCCGIPPENDGSPDIGAIVTVVKDVYGAAGEDRIIFLGADDSTIVEAMLEEARERLETELKVKVRPESEAYRDDPSLPILTPVLPETGEIGISISLSRFSVDEEGNLHVNVFYARSGLDGAGFEYVLAPEGESWIIIEVIPGAVS